MGMINVSWLEEFSFFECDLISAESKEARGVESHKSLEEWF